MLRGEGWGMGADIARVGSASLYADNRQFLPIFYPTMGIHGCPLRCLFHSC